MMEATINKLPVIGTTAKGVGLELCESLEWLLDNGIEAVEISVVSWEVKNNRCISKVTDLEKVKEALKPFKQITIHATFHNHSGLSLIAWNKSIRDAYYEELKFNLKIAKEIKASVVTFHSGGPVSDTPNPEKYLTNKFYKDMLDFELHRLDGLYANSGVMLGLENADYFQPAEYFEYFRELNLENIKITLDTNHMSKPVAGIRVHDNTYNAYEKYGSVANFIKIYADDIIHVHFNDYDPENCVGCGHLPVGVGIVDLTDALAALKNSGYTNMLSLELKNKSEILDAKQATEKIFTSLN